MIEEIVKEIINEAREGKIKISSENAEWFFYAKFYVNESIDNNYPTIDIPNFDHFIEILKDYLDIAYDFYYDDKDYCDLDDPSYIKKLVFDLLINVSQFDCHDIYNYIENKRDMLLDKSIKEGGLFYKYDDLDIEISVKKNRSNLEAPYQFIMTFKDKDNNKFELPQLTFGVVDNIVHLSCVQNKNKYENTLVKKLDRYFRKVNKDVDMEDQIANISPRALVSLTIFNSYLKSKGIEQIITPSYLPIRYNAKLVKGQYRGYGNKELEELELDINHDQYNMTNKMMYLLQRYAFHFDSTECVYDEIRDKMYTKLNDNNSNKDNIINELDKKLNIKKR